MSLRQQAVEHGPDEWIESVLRKRVVVHLKSSQTIEGSLTATMEDGLILRAASLLEPGGQRTPMAGETFIPRENVAFAQLDE